MTESITASEPKPAPVKKPWYKSARFWVSIITVVVVALLVFGAWSQVVEAFKSLSQVNLWILALLIPVQLFSFWVTGEVLFSFLRARGELRGMSPLSAMRMSLEFNFANHMLPSGGAAGIAYTTWKLNSLGVAPSKGTLAQLVRFAVTFVSFSILLVVATIWLLVSGRGSAGVLWPAAVVGGLAIVGTTVGVILLRRRRMLHRFAGFLTGVANKVLRLVRSSKRVDPIVLVRFLDGIYVEVREITAQPKTLIAPFLLSFLVNIADSSLFLVALGAFGVLADPALIFVAYGLATLASMIIVTPNGLGAYEVALVTTLVAGGLAQSTTIAAVILARVILLFGTIIFGWGFYQHSVMKAGAPSRAEVSRA